MFGLAFVLPFDSLEDFLTSESGFGLTKATVVQRAVCWVLDIGTIPDHLWEHPEVQETFGGVRPTEFHPEFLFLSGVRGAKTLICAAAASYKALTIDLGEAAGLDLRAGEVPRASILSRRKDEASEAYRYIVGAFTQSSVLAGFLVGYPTADTVFVRNVLSGATVAIKVVAMATQGISLVSRWCVSLILDEAPRMSSEDEGKINIQEQVRAVRARLLRGGVIMYCGSPKGAVGYVYDMYQRNWKSSTQTIPVAQARGDWLNPMHWTPERQREVQEADEDTYRTDFLAQFTDPEFQFFSSTVVDAAMRKDPLQILPESGKMYSAAMDPGATTNAWTFAIAETEDNRKYRVVFACEWRGSKTSPLSPKAVLTEIKAYVDMYGIETGVLTDQWAQDAHRDLAFDLGFGVSPVTMTATLKKRGYTSLHTRMNAGLVEIPPIKEMRDDLLNVKKRFSRSAGDFVIVTPETFDGRHCDYASVLMLLCGGYLAESQVADDTMRAAKNMTSDDDDEDFEEESLFWSDGFYSPEECEHDF